MNPAAAQTNTTLTDPHSEVLRIGTTGDYPPLTQYDARTGQFSGTEVEMARQFAQYLGKKPEFIKTSWPTLSADLQAGKFDMAVGGISASKERAQLFLFSQPITQFGKVPLVRCADVKRFVTVQQINQPQVTVVENIGGTNQKFAEQNLPRAKLILVVNAEETFQSLLQHKADVMITDSVEAVYRQQHMPGLCAVNPDQPFTHEEKVFLLPKTRTTLLHELNEWLQFTGKRN